MPSTTPTSLNQDGIQKEPVSQEEPKYVVPEVVLNQGEKSFKDIFGFEAPLGREHEIRIFQPEDLDEEVRVFIPTLNPLYVWPKDNTELEAAVINLIKMGIFKN